MRRWMIVLSVVALMLGLIAPAGGAETPGGSEVEINVEESPTGSYIVVMETDPLIVSFDQADLDTNAAKSAQRGLKKGHKKVLEGAGVDADVQVNEYTIALNGFSAVLDYEEAKAVARQEGVSMVLPDQMRYLTTDSSPAFLGLDGGGEAWKTGLDGEGVIVGIIDSGIWPEHPSFADDGSFPDAPVLDDSRPNCEFGNTAHNENDVPFECNNKLIGARQMVDTYRALIGAEPDEFDSARDDNGHGTHTASTAAGNADVEASMFGVPYGTVSGIAPRAQIIAYKGLGDLGGFTSDLAASIDQAVADGVDVINYSIGGGASGPGADEIAFLFADAAGVFVATSAGNSGPGASTLGNPGTMPWMTTVGASTQTRFFSGTVVLGDGSEYSGASVTLGVGEATLVDAEYVGGDLCIPGTLDPDEVEGKIVLCRRGAIARAAKSAAVFEAGGIGTILYNNSDDDNLYTDPHATPAVHIDNTPGLAIKAYIDAEGAAATASIVDTGTADVWPGAPSMTIFSSRGPNPVSADIIKPDITAPGLQILAGNTPMPIDGVQGELFQAIAGTSMSSPHVAGLFALIKQAHPDWSPAMARSALMTTAYQDVLDNDRVSPAGPFDMGSGHVDPGKARQKGSAFNPGLVYDAGLFEYAAYTCGEDFGVFTPGSCNFLESIGVPSDPSDLNYPSIGVADLAGSQTVVRTVTAVTSGRGFHDFSVSVEAPPGYDVSVSPSTLSIRGGESATYEVTITNVSAPAGEWRIGSLVWTDEDENYEVYSPIAVKGALFNAPPEVSGSGVNGSASFDVSFGYEGSYVAAPHGLSADVQISGLISQDPDQTYPSGDDSSDGVHKIEFSVSGAAFLRWELVIPGADDLDLFLENSSGTIIAASTSGGTEELIELVLPADDTYTMVVHGWSVPNAPLAYTLHYWEVPLASGGSLGVDSAPATATIGSIESVDISWAGLATGEYLGAVSHTGDVGLMGLTLVSVDVP